MKTRRRSTEAIIEEQVRKWTLLSKEKKRQPFEPAVAISRLPGSGGDQIGQKLADHLGFDLFDAEIIHKVAESARLSSACIKTLDEKGISWVENWVLALRNDRYLWRGEFIRQLANVIGVIGKHGRAVILGRGASFILPPAECLRVLVVAPLDVRIESVMKELSVSAEQAKQRVITAESERKAYIRQYFHAEFLDPIQYDLVLNTAYMNLDASLGTIEAAWNAKKSLPKNS